MSEVVDISSCNLDSSLCSSPAFLMMCSVYKLNKNKVKVKLLSSVQLFATPWSVAYQTPPSTGFSRQEHWNGLPCPPPGDLPDPGIETPSPALAGRFCTTESPVKPPSYCVLAVKYVLCNFFIGKQIYNLE